MRLLPLTLAAITAASLLPAPVMANTDPLVASICDYVKANDKNRLRKKLKENRVKLRNIYSGVICDGTSLLRVAMGAGAEDAGEFIAKRLSDTELGAAEADGLTIVDWAKANGHGGSLITTAILERLSGAGGESDD